MRHGEAKIHVEIRGNGAPILGLAGFGCSHWIFNHWTTPLEDSYCLLLPDNRGMGRSEPSQQAYSVADLADDAESVIEQYSDQPAVVMGISMGGFIAQSLAIQSPSKVHSLILMCTSSGGPGFFPLPETSRTTLQRFYNLSPEVRAQQALDQTTHPGFRTREPHLFARTLKDRMAHTAAWDQVSLQYDAVQKFMEHPLPISDIAVPTLILTGAEDRYVDPRNASVLAQKIPGAELRVIPDADHLFFLEKPDQTVDAIRQFLGANS